MIKDTLTQTNVYVTADVLPTNEGGSEYLTKKLREIVLDSIPNLDKPEPKRNSA